MKSDTITTALNLMLGMLVILGVVFALMNIMRTRELRQLTGNATVANTLMMQAQGLANDAANYNATAKNPEMTRILQSVQPKPATK